MNFKLGPVSGLQVVENSRDPGTGRIVATVLSTPTNVDGEVSNTILWTAKTPQFGATQRRFPDVAVRPGWRDIANYFDTDDEVVNELAKDVADWELQGGCVAVWDAPATFGRLAPYGFPLPARVLDLKVLNRLLLPYHRGYRTPESMALAMRVTSPADIMPGVEREAHTLQALGEAVEVLVEEGRWPDGNLAPENWGELHRMQNTAAAAQLAGLAKWMRSQQKGTEGIKAGWPVWSS